MKIVKVEDLHCDAGWRVNSFLKITTDEGIVGWSEYMEGYGAQGLTGVISKLAERHLIGQDPRPVERIRLVLSPLKPLRLTSSPSATMSSSERTGSTPAHSRILSAWRAR